MVKNSVPASSLRTPGHCMRAFLGIHTQVTKVSYVSWPVTAMYRIATADQLAFSNLLPLVATLLCVLACTVVPRVMP